MGEVWEFLISFQVARCCLVLDTGYSQDGLLLLDLVTSLNVCLGFFESFLGLSL